MSQIITSAGALATAQARGMGDLETIWSRHGNENLYGPPAGTHYNLLSDRPLWNAIFIDFFWYGNGVRLQSPGGPTRIRGTKLQKSQNNENRAWTMNCDYQGTTILSRLEAQTHGNLGPVGYFVHGHICDHA